MAGKTFPLAFCLLVLWTVLFFPRWYGLTYTKIRELQRMIGRPYERQLTVMHPPVMAKLLAIKRGITTRPSEVTVVPQTTSGLEPLAENTAIVRAIFYPYLVASECQTTVCVRIQP